MWSKMKISKEHITLLIAVAAAIAAIFSAYSAVKSTELQEDAYELILPYQKPILSYRDSKVNYSLDTIEIEDEIQLDFQIYANDSLVDEGSTSISTIANMVKFKIKHNLTNFGKGIAENLTSYIFIATLNDNSVKYVNKNSLADRIYPDYPIPIEINFNLWGTYIDKMINGSHLGFIIRYEYNNYVDNLRYNETSWGKLSLESKRIIKMSNEEKDELLKNYNLEVLKMKEKI